MFSAFFSEPALRRASGETSSGVAVPLNDDPESLVPLALKAEYERNKACHMT
jgi:hypothetical protein